MAADPTTCVTCHPTMVASHGGYAGFSKTDQYVSWTTALSLGLQNADAALMARGPHSGYATTTVKCAVCHSVHRGGSALLNEGSSCAYCHTGAYYGGGAVASNLISWTTSTNEGPHASRCANDDCHGGPHGVGASAYDGPATRLLTAKADAKLLADATANEIAATEFATYSDTTRALATGAVCSRSGCHTNSAFGVVKSGSDLVVSGVTGPSAADGLVTGHRVVAAATTNWNANGTDFPTTRTNLTIAFKPVSYCSSCHDLKDDNNAGKAAFPHAINGVVDSAAGADGTWRVAVWLTAAANAGEQSKAVGAYNNYTGGAGIAGAAGSSIIDGVCLKCHRSADGLHGIGIDDGIPGTTTPPPPPADTTPPTTTSDAVGPYTGSATITLSATDNVGGSGVANTYYTVNNVGGTGTVGTTISISAPAIYTIEFWSVDGAGNTESPRKTATFTVAPVVPVGTGTIHFAWDSSPDSWAYYEVRDSSWAIVPEGSGWGYEIEGWDGHFYVPVSVSNQPYYARILWHDPANWDYPDDYWTPGPDWPVAGSVTRPGYPNEEYVPIVIDQSGEQYDFGY
jgi:hypothetical protein